VRGDRRREGVTWERGQEERRGHVGEGTGGEKSSRGRGERRGEELTWERDKRSQR
jgi:hypothetical protein